VIDLRYLTQASETLPSVRFRVLPFVRLAGRRGISADWKKIPKTAAGRVFFYLALPRVKNLVIQKRLLTGFELSLLRRRCERLIFDFDDAVWTSHPNVEPGPARDAENQKHLARLFNVCASADLVVAGNSFLADKVRDKAGHILILPTPIDTEVYRPADGGRAPGRVTVGWIGTSCNLFFLPEVFAALAPVRDKVAVTVVSDEAMTGPDGFDFRFEKWDSEREVEQLKGMDIGLMPLTDDEYTRGKCGFKLLQYMACGVVPVASDVGFNREIITHGVDGFLVGQSGQWAEYVGRLAGDAGLREQMSAAAREKIVTGFSLDAAAEKLFSRLALV